jgi:hypothetical protein
MTNPIIPADTYARRFDQSNKHWMAHSDSNRIFLECQQSWANDRLRAYGHLFLNEVYDCLGLPRSTAGAMVGWYSEPGSHDVDFNITEGENGVFHLDFNVDGVIYHRLG